MDRLIRVLIIFFALLFLFTVGPIWLYVSRSAKMGRLWFHASRESVGIAPNPATTKQAIIQVYAARAFNWRGLFAVHTWLAMKPANASHFTIYQVFGWNRYLQRPLVDISQGPPDRLWYDNQPRVIRTIKGDRAAALIPKIEQAIAHYPYADSYHAWPGPNSNTFIAWIGRQVPALRLVMPASALGKDYLAPHQVLARVPSGSGWQFSLHGLFGFLVSLRSGLQINLLGLTLGLSYDPPAIILPGVGRISRAQPW